MIQLVLSVHCDLRSQSFVPVKRSVDGFRGEDSKRLNRFQDIGVVLGELRLGDETRQCVRVPLNLAALGKLRLWRREACEKPRQQWSQS